MSNPQLENGYTKISNEILDHLIQTKINENSWQLVLFIIRKTYGFNKKQDKISLSQFVLATQLKKSVVCRGLSRLNNMNIIIRIANDECTTYRFNKDFDTWKPLAKLLTLAKQQTTVSRIANQSVSSLGTYKRNNTTKEILNTYKYDENIKETYKTKDKIYKQLGKEYKPTKKTSAQEKSITAMKLLDYFRDKAMELHRISYLTRPEDKNQQMIKKAIECFTRFETKEKCMELVDWYLDGYGEWNKYEPTTCFMSKTYQAFENKDVDVKKKGGVFKIC